MISQKRNSRVQSDANSYTSGRSSQLSSLLTGGEFASLEAGPSRSINDFNFGGIESSSSFNSGRSHNSISSISKVGTSGIAIHNVDSLSNAEIVENFELFVHSIAPGDAEASRLRALPIDNKRALLHSSALKQKQAVKRHGRTEKSITSSPRAPVGHADDPPQAYIRKFLSGNILHTDVSHLSVSLRTMPLEWLKEFIELRGPSVLANVLHTINHRTVKREGDATLEAEVVKCMRHVVNYPSGASDVSSQPTIVASIAASIMSPQLQTRRQAVEILLFLISWDKPRGHSIVLRSFDALQAHYEENSRFDPWLKSFEATIDGRGRMGSLVGASDELKNAISADSMLVDYAVVNLLLVNQLVGLPEDSAVRHFLRTQLETSGLKRITDKLRNLQHLRVDDIIDEYEELAEEDYDLMIQSQNNEVLGGLSTTEDVFRAILSSVEGSRGRDFFHAALQHLLLLPAETETRTRYLQLVDSIISSIVMDGKGGVTTDFSSLANVSVGKVVSRFTDQDRMQKLENQLENERMHHVKTRRQKDALEQELALYNATNLPVSSASDTALVSTLQRKLTEAEESLRISREAMHKVQENSDEMEDKLREKITELEALIRELFDMLKQTKGFHDLITVDETTMGDGKKSQQREFITELEKKLARHKTAKKLEGTRILNALDADDENDGTEDVEVLETKPGRRTAKGKKLTNKKIRAPQELSRDISKLNVADRDSASSVATYDSNTKSDSHASQFMDAEDEEVQEHHEKLINEGVSLLVPSQLGNGGDRRPSPRTLRFQNMPKDLDRNIHQRKALTRLTPGLKPEKSSKRISSDSALITNKDAGAASPEVNILNKSHLNDEVVPKSAESPITRAEPLKTSNDPNQRQSNKLLNTKPAFLDEIRSRGRRSPSGILLDKEGRPMAESNISTVQEEAGSEDDHSEITLAHASGFTTQSDDTQVTSTASGIESKSENTQNPFVASIQNQTKNLRKLAPGEKDMDNNLPPSDKNAEISSAAPMPVPPPPPPPPPSPPMAFTGPAPLSQGAPIPPPPPPPPAPPLPVAPSTTSKPNAPPAPPPPPPPPGTTAPNASLANILKSGNLREAIPATNTGLPPPPPPPPSSSRPASVLFNAQKRKELPDGASQKMKQLQWDKINQLHLDKTVWGLTNEAPETEWFNQLKRDGVWIELEEDFKSKQMVLNLMNRKKDKDLISVLDVSSQKRIEIVMQRVKQYSPEQIAAKILSFDEDFCTQTFLSELKPVLPTPEQAGKLAPYRDAGPEVLITLHPADRLMVQLIKIERMGPRIEGMLYKSVFEEVYSILSESVEVVHEASENLMAAPKFIEMLKLVLLIGNYMNAQGVKGGAFGFKITSLNKMVDTKSTNGTTLVHFLERTVAKHFTEMEGFIDELSKPADAYRVNLTDVRKGLGDLREGLKHLISELEANFSEPEKINPKDGYPERMWKFSAVAKEKLDGMVDRLALADSSYQNTARFYGELEKLPSTSEFFGVFKQFLSSYKKCKNENQSYAEEKASIEKRRQAKEARAKERAAIQAAYSDPAGESIMDTLLEKLKQGESAPRRRARRGNRKSSLPPIPQGQSSVSHAGNEAAMAADMLASLQNNGFLPSLTEAPKEKLQESDERMDDSSNDTKDISETSTTIDSDSDKEKKGVRFNDNEIENRSSNSESA
ncbi:hypothetical protein WALSEDRAFT_60895 [Wallemia mellicola CBS 633.66]|uniref:Actin-binding FH2 n=1 Tax=Wallemia mellicola (strain ATCC MYA-4683 / CBS 633.66) TaxID=671144 RepID=I4Y9J5_WALMC|nr:hypothetical protein WALSEDRAFT_60895 [Wallemia mellicola CBS 633.66]EIM20637.1 hypothetical protein WALSEDRAFT_60895 [Wallemia mellicola CBS 633.66]|eukprot:XP_006959421.1 hypothetical protein WALSEDRAFT_60895 [Wallemia mellicola CBS 633.66]